jgi:hypothetical protein
MKRFQNFLPPPKSLVLILTIFFLFFQCSEEEIIEPAIEKTADPEIYATSTTCQCTYTVPANTHLIDGKALNLKPGAIICLNASTLYKNLQFKNIVGSATQPIIIKNCGGTATLTATGLSFGVKFISSKYFRITGGNTSNVRSIKINGAHIGMTLDYLSTDFEVDHIEVANSGFAGIMAKTDPSCDNATIRQNFTMTNVSFHDNYVHHSGGEGFYIGNSFYEGVNNTSCGLRLPHEIHNVKIYNNLVQYSGWEGIQLGCATKGASVYGNRIENYGTANVTNQSNGVQLGGGTGGLFYNNFIKNGPGNGLIVLGLGDNIIHDNVIVNAGSHGIFCDERYSPGPGFKFLNNTIINPKGDGIRLYADLVPMNVIMNNVIVNPGTYSTYMFPRTGNDAYVYKLSGNVKVQMSNNYFTRSITAPKFVNAGAYNYRLSSTSPLINKGKSISTYNIAKDFYQQTRLKGTLYDIGASEY